jgi:plastocyanin
MRSADQLDDLWERGLTALADAPSSSPETRPRVSARAGKQRRERVLARAVAVIAMVALAAGAAAVIATRGDDDGASFTTVPTTVEPQQVTVWINDAELDITPQDLAPGPVAVTFQVPDSETQEVTLHLPGDQTVVASPRTPGEATFVAAERAHYDLVAKADDGTTLATGSLDVFPPYVAPTGDPAASVEITARPALKDEPDVVHVTAGVVEFRLRDEAAGQHTFTIYGKPGFILEVNNAGQVESGKIELAPGEYHFSCSIPGHREAGEEGTLIVEDK